MTPAYAVRVWQDDEWWLARVVDASEGADPAPLNALTQSRSLPRIESMGRDLIATILGADEEDFRVEFEYDLPGDAGELVCQAKGARAWLDVAQDLWQKRSAEAARALSRKGYSLREAATLLGLSHQRIDQLLGRHVDDEPSRVVVYEYMGALNGENRRPPGHAKTAGIGAFLVLRRDLASPGAQDASPGSDMEAILRERVQAFVSEVESHVSHQPGLAS